MTVILTALSPDAAAAQWAVLRPLIDIGFAAGGDFMPEDFPIRVGDGRVLIWVAIDDASGEVLVAVTTELIPMRIGLVCWIGQCGGERLREWAHFIKKIEEYARAEGCVKTIIKGRFGWERIFGDYRVRTVTLEKVL